MSEASDEGFLEELINGQLKLLAEVAGGLADIPLVHIDGGHTSHLGETDGIEGTGNGFLPMETATSESGVDGTESTSTFMLDEDTVFAMNDLRDKFSFPIGIDNAFGFNLLLSLG